jgi:hypothetical protein
MSSFARVDFSPDLPKSIPSEKDLLAAEWFAIARLIECDPQHQYNSIKLFPASPRAAPETANNWLTRKGQKPP